LGFEIEQGLMAILGVRESGNIVLLGYTSIN
jgi:hypothetical protein